MKKNLLVLMSIFLLSAFAIETNAAPSFTAPETVSVIQGSGDNMIVLTEVSDVILFSPVVVAEGAEFLDGTPLVEYANGNSFATLRLKEKGLKGTVKLTVASGAVSKTVTVNIAPPNKPGIMLEMYDAVFWGTPNVIATGSAPIYTEWVEDASFPAEKDPFWDGKWETIIKSVTTDSDCDVCNPYPIPDMGTSTLKGYFIPKVSGDHIISMRVNRDAGALYFDKTATSWDRATKIADVAQNDEDPNSNIGSSSPIALEAGKAYPIYALRWYIHRLDFDIRVTEPGGAMKVIPGDMLTPIYDVTKPAKPTTLQVNKTLAEKVRLVWKKVSDGTKVAKVIGYNIYVNGVKDNDEPLNSLEYLVEGLTPATSYVLFITSVDSQGNESLASNYVSANTPRLSQTQPTPPTQITMFEATGQTLKLKWRGAWASYGKVAAYDVYVDDVKYNTEDYVYADTIFIRGLQPETSYKIEIVAYNSTLVASEKSEPANFTTAVFDAKSYLGLQYGDHGAVLNIEKKNISWSEGIGINADVKGTELYANGGNNDLDKGLKTLQPGSIRWGGIDANEYAFESVSGDVAEAGQRQSTIGKARKDQGRATHAMNMNYCNELGAYYALCTGMREVPYKVDYIEFGGATFLKLIEYLAGPATSTYGAIRAEEGFTQPLLKKGTSKGLILEFGNEVWGSNSHYAPMGSDYIKYGQWCRQMATAIKTSPYWEDIKDMVYMVYSARDPRSDDSYGLHESLLQGAKGEVNTFGPAGYLGGNLDYNPGVDYGQSVLEYYRLRQRQAMRNLEGLELGMKQQMKDGYDPLYVFFYEAQASSQSYFGNLGQGVLLNDYLTASMKYSSIVPAIFCYGGGEWRITLGDGTPLAHYAIAKLVNEHCKGHIVSTNLESGNVLMAGNGIDPMPGYDPVGSSVYNNGKKWSILLFSRDYENDYKVQLNLPDNMGFIKNGKKYLVTGDGSENGPSIRTEFVTDSVDVTVSDNMVVTVPKYSMVLITFEANDPMFTKLPLGYFAFANESEELKVPAALEITTNKGSIAVPISVLPYNSTARATEWEVKAEDNPHYLDAADLLTARLSPDGAAVTIRATGLCNGVVYLRGWLAGKEDKYEIIKVTISGQEDDPSCNIRDKFTVADPFAGFDPVSVEEVANTLGNQVYPNPADDVLFVKTTDAEGLATINVYSSTGARIMSETTSSQLVELQVSSLSSGYYVVTIEKGGKVQTLPFLKK